MNNKSFGKELIIDIYDVNEKLCDDLEHGYRFLEELVHFLGMNSFFGPIVVHGPRDKDGKEIYPDKAGLSGVIFLIESSIVIHSIKDKKFCCLNIFSCGHICKNGVKEFVEKWYPHSKAEVQLVERGIDYGTIS